MQDTGLLGQIEAAKPVVQEPRGTGDAFDSAMRDFYAGIDGKRGAILFAVCRGKVQTSPLLCFLSRDRKMSSAVSIPAH